MESSSMIVFISVICAVMSNEVSQSRSFGILMTNVRVMGDLEVSGIFPGA